MDVVNGITPSHDRYVSSDEGEDEFIAKFTLSLRSFGWITRKSVDFKNIYERVMRGITENLKTHLRCIFTVKRHFKVRFWSSSETHVFLEAPLQEWLLGGFDAIRSRFIIHVIVRW